MKVITIITHQNRGGIFKRLSIMVESLLKNGYEVHYLSVEPLALAEHENLVPHVMRLPVRQLSGAWFWLCVSVAMPVYLLGIVMFRKFSAIAVFSTYYSCLANLAALMTRTPIVLFMRSVPWSVRRIKHSSSTVRWLSALRDYVGLTCASKVVAVTDTMHEELISKLSFLKNRVVTLPNAVVYPKALAADALNASEILSQSIAEDVLSDTEKPACSIDIGVSARDAFEQQADPTLVKCDASERKGYSIWQERVNEEQWKAWIGGFANRKKEVAQRCHLSEKSVFMVTSGELNSQRDIDYLIRAMGAASSDKISLIICGEGTAKETILALAAGYGQLDRIILAGWLDDPMEVVAGCDLYIMTSQYDGMSNAVLEALGAGVPVIGPDTKEMREVLAYDELLFDPNNVGNFALMLDNFATNRSKLDIVRKLSHERAQSFSFSWGCSVIELVDEIARVI